METNHRYSLISDDEKSGPCPESAQQYSQRQLSRRSLCVVISLIVTAFPMMLAAAFLVGKSSAQVGQLGLVPGEMNCSAAFRFFSSIELRSGALRSQVVFSQLSLWSYLYGTSFQ